MKHNKHIHDEDYDINIKLMVPLLSMLVCTICLCATTWAWYTASVSTGVNSIKAGVSASAYINNVTNGSATPNEDGSYTLTNDSDSEASFTIYFSTNSGTAANGYLGLITIDQIGEYSSVSSQNEENVVSLGKTLLNLITTRVLAEGEEENTSVLSQESSIKKYVFFKDFDNSINLSLSANTIANLKIEVVWAEPNFSSDTESFKFEGIDYQKCTNGEGISISKHVETQSNEENNAYILTSPESTASVNTKYQIKFEDIDGLQNFDAIEQETIDGNLVVNAPDGYLLVPIGEETEGVSSRVYSIEELEGYELIVNVQKKETEQTYAYTIHYVTQDNNDILAPYIGEAPLGSLTLEIPVLEGYVPCDNTGSVEFKVTDNANINVFSIMYKKIYTYEVHYVDDNNNILESVSNQTSLDQVEVPLKQFDDKELVIIEAEKADTTVRTFAINKELETNIFEIRYTTIVPPENTEPLQEEQLSSN